MRRFVNTLATLLTTISSVSAAQTQIDATLVNALMEAAALPLAVSQTAAKCAQLVPDQATELREASAYWKRINVNEGNFVIDVLDGIGQSNAGALSRINAQANARTAMIMAELNLNPVNCNRWLSQVMTTKEWTHTARIPAQMKLIEQRFVKPS
jgi:hypothetical protein